MSLFKKNMIAIIILTIMICLSIISTYFIYKHIQSSVKNDISNSLQTVVDTTEQSLVLWINEEKALVKSWTSNNLKLIEYVELLLKTPYPNEELTAHPITEQIRHYFEPLIKNKNYLDFSVISPEYINIASSLNNQLGQKNSFSNDKELLQRSFNGEVILSLPQLSSIKSSNSLITLKKIMPTMSLISPIYNQQQVIALLVFKIDPRSNFTHLLQLGRMGESGETYAFNDKAILISESRFTEQLQDIGMISKSQSGILNISISDPGIDLTKNDANVVRAINDKPLTLMAESAISGSNGINLAGYRDYRGVMVVGAWKWNEKLGFGVTTEIDFDEVYITLNKISVASIIGVTLNSLLITILAIIFILYSNTIRRQSLEDGLTGIANRRMLDIKLENEVAHSIRSNKPISICMIDVDRFKLFNDHSGHVAGDAILIVIAQTIKSVIKRRSDLVARYGGEEFCVVLPNTEIDDAINIAEDIRLTVLHAKISRNNADENPWVTVSVGVTSQQADKTTNINSIVAKADKALYLAKNSGRNCTKIYKDE